MGLLNSMMLGQDDYVNSAANRTLGIYDRNLEAAKRQASRLGINANSGAYLSMLKDAQYNQAAGTAAAANEAQYSWLNAAQNQYNTDRNYALRKDAQDFDKTKYWNNFNWDKQMYNDTRDDESDSLIARLRAILGGR